MTSTITHRPKVEKRQRGPFFDYRMHCPACGTHTPWDAYRENATRARDRHLWENGQNG
jgi:hypothetical protein